jgi:hypothetical protein
MSRFEANFKESEGAINRSINIFCGDVDTEVPPFTDVTNSREKPLSQ